MPIPHLTGPIIFDLDGTLVDSAPDLTEALNRVLIEQDLPPVTAASVRHMVGDGAVKMIERGFAAAGKRFDGTLPDQLRQSFLDHYADCLIDQTVPYPGVIAALERFSAAGRRMAVCTNKPFAMSEVVLAELGLARFFDAVLGGDSLAVHKPDPAHLHAAIEGAGGRAPRAIMVGDSATDVAAARNTGVPVVVVSFGYTRIAPRDLGADAVIDHFDELIPALAALAENSDAQ
ncbi:MAG: phosphoglycolate phosphatase [Alphaproteobacteria bacterium]